ncbi:alpha/beta fold hydrolase [Kitasatospora paracochleata]|uniref:Pimeloyl-ACP methyl ester carboxylesterase n=1 Tax=Kitasatospora paracochleata TaxID=58354 RepID=A0ABT1IZ65_9ACTN|nr:alpha/beta fold hydrolase [Kitasatospora paracochleata]MCP2310445.1 pimeloyl-ACP methyl ester carboxylesterase [Kitasatospora paracochleata]
MKLHVHEWGTGERVALLVHGLMSDHRAWRRVGPALAERGYRVIAVDLRGHGRSPRGEGATPAEKYSPALFAEDLVDTLPTGAELAIGHSLGGLALLDAVERLKPARAVYSDPAWRFARAEGVDPRLFVEFKHASGGQIAALNPRWEQVDVEVELATLAVWDSDSALGLWAHHADSGLPAAPAVPSLVQLADRSFLVDPQDAAVLRGRGFEVRTVPGAGHTVQRDDFDGFMASLEGWI